MELVSEIRLLSVAASHKSLLSQGWGSLPRPQLSCGRLKCHSSSVSEGDGGGTKKNAGLKDALDAYFERLEKTTAPSSSSSSPQEPAAAISLEGLKQERSSSKEEHTTRTDKLKSLQDEYALKEELLMAVLKEYEQAEAREKEAAAASSSAAAAPADEKKGQSDPSKDEDTPLVILKNPNKGSEEVPLLLMRRGSLVVSTIVGINIGVYIFGLATSQQAETGVDQAFLQAAKVNDLILAGEWWRLITPTFLHSGFVHLFFSCWSIISFGPLVESLYGSIGLVLIYLLGGVMGNVTSFFQTSQSTVGGSGAAFALACSWIVFLAKNRDAVRTFDTGELLQKVLVLSGLTVLVGNELPVDAWTHVGGAMVGILFGLVASPWYQITNASQIDSSKTDLTLERLALLFLLCSGALLWLRLSESFNVL